MQRRFTFFIFTLFISLASFSQIAMSFEEAQSQGIQISMLDSLYLSGIHSDSSKAVFADQQQEYIKAYYAMLHDLNAYLNQNDFRWGGQTRCFNRIYFDESGEIDYFLFNFQEGELAAEKQDEFAVLLNEFIGEFKFSLSKNVKFAQCSPVNFRDIL
ncbi:MAG: hypothetical protein RIC35_19380 [Marinoscillum sp.]